MPRRLRFIPDDFRVPVEEIEVKAEVDLQALALNMMAAAFAAFGEVQKPGQQPVPAKQERRHTHDRNRNARTTPETKPTNRKKKRLGVVVFEVTLKTMGDQFLLRPDKAMLALLYGMLGRALSNTGVLHFANSIMSNHLSLLVGVRSINQLANFTRQFGGGTSLRVRKLLGLSTRLWARRNQSIPTAPDRATLLDRMGYVFGNGTKEGLVAHPSQWPGGNSARYFCNGEAQEGTYTCLTTYHAALKRDPNTRIEDHQTHYVIPHHRLPGFEDLSHRAYKQLMRGLCDDRAAMAAAARTPDSAPLPDPETLSAVPRETRPKHPKRSPAPRCHAASTAVQMQFQKDYLAYVDRHRAARADLLASLHATAGTFDEGIEPTGCRELDPDDYVCCEVLPITATDSVMTT